MPFVLSVLDQSPIAEGSTGADALRNSIDLARHTETLGYERYWVAEHHGTPMLASAAPEILIAEIAAATSRIRVGSGGVMLPHYSPLKVAEVFSMLAGLHPGRIDLGIGRAPGTDQATAAALRGGSPHVAVEQFPDHLGMVLALLGDDRVAPERIARLRATPSPDTYPDVWMLGSSTYGAQVAAALGLPFVYAYHFAMSSDVDGALAVYRNGFQPSPKYPQPHVMVSASVIAAETRERAEFLAGPSRIMALSLRTGRIGPMVSPEAAAAYELSDLDRSVLSQLPGTQYAGTADEVVAGLDALVERTGADELILAGSAYDPATRQETLTRIAASWGLQSRQGELAAAR
jgi:luciferase family oxidoreductase group 1